MNSKLKILVSVMAMSFIMVGCGETPANVSGEAFLKTKGGSVITCAGNPVYIEKADINGYILLTDSIEVVQNGIRIGKLAIASELSTYYSRNIPYDTLKKIIYWEKRLKNNPSNSAKIYINEELKPLQKLKKDADIKNARVEKVRKEIEEKGNAKIILLQKQLASLESRLMKTNKNNIKSTTCGSQGQFSFLELQSGKYYISTTVQWKVGNEIQGGNVNKVITLKEGSNQVIISE